MKYKTLPILRRVKTLMLINFVKVQKSCFDTRVGILHLFIDGIF